MATVRLDGMLKDFGPPGRCETSAPSVEGLLTELETRYPRLVLKLRDETGAVRRYIRVFVNGEDIRGGQGLQTPITTADRIEILHSIAGG